MSKKPDIASRIREDIISGVLPSGSRLTIDQLSGRYATSHMPVREALRQLAGEGIVDFKPNRGVWVREISTQFVKDLIDMRASVESFMARQAAEVATADDVAVLEEIQARYERFVEIDDRESAILANAEFHRQIYALSANSEALSLINRHWVVIASLWKRYGYPRQHFAGVINDHRQLIYALSENDGRAAELIIGGHVVKSRQYLVQQMLEVGEQSTDQNAVACLRTAS